jgi:hypothetical protein
VSSFNLLATSECGDLPIEPTIENTANNTLSDANKALSAIDALEKIYNQLQEELMVKS